jgi:putative endonuclease
MSQKIGIVGEKQACAYLLSQGLQWIESNYRCRWGEIDLIMHERDYLVFIEVRARTSAAFGGALASVTYSKQRKLIQTATHYLLARGLYNKQPTRFDILAFEGVASRIDWIKNAFELRF